MVYEKQILALMDFDGFCKQFYAFCREYSTQELAYDATERMYMRYFGKAKYSSFESFRELKNRTLRDRKKK